MKRVVALLFVFATLSTASGCCVVREIFWSLPHCGPCGIYGLGPCGGGCGGCGGCGGSGDCGCGNVYWNEWSDPPSCLDKCDCCGNWTGPDGYAGWRPDDGYGPMSVGPTYHQRPILNSGPTPAGPVSSRPMYDDDFSYSQPTGKMRSKSMMPYAARPQRGRQMAAHGSPRGQRQFNAPPSDDEMQLPPGAKILSRDDRLMSESEQPTLAEAPSAPRATASMPRRPSSPRRRQRRGPSRSYSQEQRAHKATVNSVTPNESTPIATSNSVATRAGRRISFEVF